jgi:hypothetical protein
MPINNESLNHSLYNLLAKYKPKPLDAEGKVTPVPDEADIFKFQFTKDGKDYGTVFVTLDEDRVLTVYFSNDVTESPPDATPNIGYDDTWSGLLHQLSSWRMTKGLKGFDTQNNDRVKDDMARRKHMRDKDKIAEGYYPMGKKSSYSDSIPSVKIVIEHSRVIEEGEQRYRNINRIFLENQAGERYLLDTKKPGIARVYARHIAEGGKVNDDRWSHIGSLCEEYQKMAGFVRATRNGQFNESAQQLVNEGLEHYQSLRESLSRMTGKRGYTAYFESWTPSLMEDGTEENNLNELFVQETLDPRIESVMPILNRIHKKVSESTVDKEMHKLAEWADSLTEGPAVDANAKSPTGSQSAAMAHYADQLDHDASVQEDESITSNNPVGIPEDDVTEDQLDDAQDKIRHLMQKYHWSRQEAIEHLYSDETDDSDWEDSRFEKAPVKETDMAQADSSLYRNNREQPNDKMDHFKALDKAAKMMGYAHFMDVPDDEVERHKAIVRKLRAGENVDEAADLVDLEPHLKGLKSEFDKLLKHGERMDTDPEFARKAEKRYAKYKTDDELATDDMESDKVSEGAGSGWYVTHEKRSGDPDNVAGPFADQQKAQAWMDDNLPMHLDDSGQYNIAQMEGVDEGLDANQKRAGQLGPTEKVKNNNIGKLVGANENFINTVDQAVVSEEDEMDEGTHTQHDKELNPNDYERPPTDWSTDPIEAGTDRIHQKISSILKKLSKPNDTQDLDEAAAPWEDEDEDKEGDKKPKDKKGSDGADHDGNSRAKHLAKQAIPKEEVKEGQDELARILTIMNHRR